VGDLVKKVVLLDKRCAPGVERYDATESPPGDFSAIVQVPLSSFGVEP
jgi:hypothetical protein